MMMTEKTMKKTLITLSAFAMAVMATAPAHAISAHYRAQLEKSGCTMQTDGHGCDIHKTRSQNAAAAHTGAHASDFSPFVGVWDMKDPKGKAIKEITVTRNSIKYGGHLVEEPKIDGDRVTFRVQAAEFTLLAEGIGNWTGPNVSGAVTRQ